MSNNNIKAQLDNLLVTKNFSPETIKAGNDDVLSFDYKGKSGRDYGQASILLHYADTTVPNDTNRLDVYFGDNLGKSMEPEDKQSWFDDFLLQLRQLAKRNVFLFNLMDISKLKYSLQGQAAIREGIFESWRGTKTASWNSAPAAARLMIKHKKTIGEGDARFRYIESLFVETAEGERHKLAFANLAGGRAMVEHVRQGGKPYDARGQHITTIVNEMSLLSRFRRASQHKIFEGDAAQLVTEASQYFETLRRNLKSLATHTGYNRYFESWDPAAVTDEDVIIEDLRHMFIETNIDSRIEQALPLLAKLKKQDTDMKEANIFESWMNLLSEGTWALPDTKEKQSKLVELLSQDFPVGADAINATEQLYDLLGDDELFDKLHELADEDANADARTVILARLEELKNDHDVAQVIGKLKVEQPDETRSKAESSLDVMENFNGYQIKKKVNESAVNWTDLSNDLSINDKISIFESYYADGILLESNDDNVEYFQGLSRFTVDPKQDKRYIVTPLLLIQNKVISLDSNLLNLTFVKRVGSQMIFSNDSGDFVKFPTNLNSTRGLTHTFVFDNSQSYDKFRTELALKFNLDLPAAPTDLTELDANTIDRYKKAAGQQIKDLEPEVSGEYGDIAQRMIDRRKRGLERVPDHDAEQLKEYKEFQYSDTVTVQGFGVGKIISKGPLINQWGSSSKFQNVSGPKYRVKFANGHEADVPAAKIQSTVSSAKFLNRKNLRDKNVAEERTETKDETGKVVSWKDVGDWKKVSKPTGGAGKAANLSDRARRSSEKLKEAAMTEVDMLLKDIAAGNIDIMTVYVNPKSMAEKFVAKQIGEKIKGIARSHGMDVKRDLDKILPIIQKDLEQDYTVDEAALGKALGTVAGEILAPEIPGSGAIGGALGSEIQDKISETVGGGNWLENDDEYVNIGGDRVKNTPADKLAHAQRTFPNLKKVDDKGDPVWDETDSANVLANESLTLQGQYGHSGRMEPVVGHDQDMIDRIRALAGIRASEVNENTDFASKMADSKSKFNSQVADSQKIYNYQTANPITTSNLSQHSNTTMAKQHGFSDVRSWYRDIAKRLGSNDPTVYKAAEKELQQYELNVKRDRASTTPNQHTDWIASTQEKVKLSRQNALAEATPIPAKPAIAAWMGDTEWTNLVNTMGQAEAEKEARERSPQARAAQNTNKLKWEKQQAEIARLRDPLQKQKALQRLELEKMRAQGNELRSTMSQAEIHGLDSDKLGQIGQMSTLWHPKNDKENYQTQPGQVQLTGQKRNQQSSAAPVNNQGQDSAFAQGFQQGFTGAQSREAQTSSASQSTPSTAGTQYATPSEKFVGSGSTQPVYPKLTSPMAESEFAELGLARMRSLAGIFIQP